MMTAAVAVAAVADRHNHNKSKNVERQQQQQQQATTSTATATTNRALLLLLLLPLENCFSYAPLAAWVGNRLHLHLQLCNSNSLLHAARCTLQVASCHRRRPLDIAQIRRSAQQQQTATITNVDNFFRFAYRVLHSSILPPSSSIYRFIFWVVPITVQYGGKR